MSLNDSVFRLHQAEISARISKIQAATNLTVQQINLYGIFFVNFLVGVKEFFPQDQDLLSCHALFDERQLVLKPFLFFLKACVVNAKTRDALSKYRTLRRFRTSERLSFFFLTLALVMALFSGSSGTKEYSSWF